MTNNITNIINIVVNALPPPPPSTSANQTSPSPSASGTSRSIGEQLVDDPGFWALMPVSKDEDLEGTPLREVTVGGQPTKTDEEIAEEDKANGHPPPGAFGTLKTPDAPETLEIRPPAGMASSIC
ncbi:uncharacterized protein PGRI_038370 [Penicillium griseofulvum]|uniref:Uncharacterized protein n=1 Tax=Penicillium patulum TaxID=5078 RepID=A0A135LDP6_PENPA|nr:uncharacterized protein PGRI_038370 [Penicillium griseofulvum]KXG47091.1 hypothetical protein PGRI_038370 [Penicillium griseofulvum]